MIAFPSDLRVWLAGGVTDMRRGMHSLSTIHLNFKGETT